MVMGIGVRDGAGCYRNWRARAKYTVEIIRFGRVILGSPVYIYYVI